MYYKGVVIVLNTEDYSMSTLEATVSMLEMLPESELEGIQNYIIKYCEDRKIENPFRPLSEQELMDRLELARRQCENGECMTGDEAVARLRAEYV